MKTIEIMDTTLRDGEQTEEVSFIADEKLTIARYLLEKAMVDAVEATSARISDSEAESVKKITEWAKKNNCLDKIEVLGFVDGTSSAQWIYDAGCKVINLLTKGSLRHLKGQLRKTPEEHANDIKQVFNFAKNKGMKVNAYLEDWSNGMQDSKDYVFFLTKRLEEFGVNRVMLADTLGVLNHDNTYSFVSEMVKKFPNLKFDFHGHNDYDLAVSNSIAAAKAGATRIHTTVNGLGERAGNTKLASVVAALNDLSGYNVKVNEKKLSKLSSIVEAISGIRVADNTPVVGKNVYTQACGVHADGDRKAGLYHNKLKPERFGETRRYSLGKTAGMASVEQNLEQLGIELDKEQKKKILDKIKELAHKKQKITREDLPYIITDVLETPAANKVELLDYRFKLDMGGAPEAKIKLRIEKKEHEASATGNGQYDAFMNALGKITKLPKLIDYSLRIPPGGKTSALVETMITWVKDDKVFKTKGVDSDQLLAAVEATIKMLNMNGL